MKKQMKDRVGDFMEGKGFYIVLFLCVAAIGISGYYLFSSVDRASEADVAVVNPITVSVPSAPVTPIKPEPPVETMAPRASAAVRSTPSAPPIPTATPALEPIVTASVFTWPVKGAVLSPFSLDVLSYDETMDDWRTHGGIDIAAALGAQVRAAAGGTVTTIDQNDLLGTTVTIDHGNGLVSIYSNLASVPSVQVDDIVATGDFIGAVGKTAIGESEMASHLHFEMAKDGLPTAPTSYLPEHQS